MKTHGGNTIFDRTNSRIPTKSIANSALISHGICGDKTAAQRKRNAYSWHAYTRKNRVAKV